MADRPEPAAPHDIEAERSVLGAVMLQNEMLPGIAAVICSSDFYREAHANIFTAMRTLGARNSAIDLVTLKAELGRASRLGSVGGPAYIAALVDGVPRSMNAEHYARIIKRRAEARCLIAYCQKAIADFSHNPEALSDGAGQRFYESVGLVVAEATDGKPLTATGRIITLTPASQITIEPVRWLWHERIPLSAISLVAGREGVGKTLLAYTLAADMTRGRLRGDLFGVPHNVIVIAGEDSWAHTICPRLMAADADLDRVFRVDVKTRTGSEVSLSLPDDMDELARAIEASDAKLAIVDPLISRMDAGLDSHKDAEARRMLEPLGQLADKRGMAILGLIHVNKSKGNDVLNTVMASRAFTAVPRAVIAVLVDPNDESKRLVCVAKSNVGRTDDLPTFEFRVVATHVADTDRGSVTTGKLDWCGESDRSIRTVLEQNTESAFERTEISEASMWLQEFLESHGGVSSKADVQTAAKQAGHSMARIHRARISLRVSSEPTTTFPRTTLWRLPLQSSRARGETFSIETTGTTETTGAQSFQLFQSFQSKRTPHGAETTGPRALRMGESDERI